MSRNARSITDPLYKTAVRDFEGQLDTRNNPSL